MANSLTPLLFPLAVQLITVCLLCSRSSVAQEQSRNRTQERLVC